MSDFYSVMNEINSLFNNNEENFDRCHEYCLNTFGTMGKFYFNAFYSIKNTLPNAKQPHDHVLTTRENITTCLDCDYWVRDESKKKEKIN